MVERQLPKLDVAGSIPVARSNSLSDSQTPFSKVRETLETSCKFTLRKCQPPEMTLATDFRNVGDDIAWSCQIRLGWWERIRLYDLRHSCATLLLVAEKKPKVVSESLGHSTEVLTLDTYSHVLPAMQQGATARLERLLENSEAAQESDPTVTQAKSAG